VSIVPTDAPTFTSAPDAAAIESTPAAGARSSRVALSDSISARTSSFSTHSPSDFVH